MSSPILGDSPSPHERPKREQINLKHMPLENHNTYPLTNTSDPIQLTIEIAQVGTLLSTFVKFLTDSTGHIVRAQGPADRQQFPSGEYQSETGWGPENSITRYEFFASALQSKPLQHPGHGTRKPRGRNATKSTQPAGELRRSARIEKKQFERLKRDSNTLRTTVVPQELRVLEEENSHHIDVRQTNTGGLSLSVEPNPSENVSDDELARDDRASMGKGEKDLELRSVASSGLAEPFAAASVLSLSSVVKNEPGIISDRYNGTDLQKS
jgi:hypothetical protein